MSHTLARHPVVIEGGDEMLHGELTIPSDCCGLVLFAHGSGSGRHSPRNRFVADYLNESGIGTLLFDLLSDREAEEDARKGNHRFDIDLLTWRLRDATEWALSYPETSRYQLGYFGASTGAAAALGAAARRPDKVAAIVSRGGRPDLLATSTLARVAAPTLLVVGGHDPETLILNRQAYAALRCPKDLAVVRSATHLFSEPGALETVAGLAAGWFRRHFSADT